MFYISNITFFGDAESLLAKTLELLQEEVDVGVVGVGGLLKEGLCYGWIVDVRNCLLRGFNPDIVLLEELVHAFCQEHHPDDQDDGWYHFLLNELNGSIFNYF